MATNTMGLRFTHCYSADHEGIKQIDLDGVKFEVWSTLGTISEFGDFCSTDLYLFAELVAEYQPREVSIAFCSTLLDCYEAAKEAAKAANLPFYCTAG
jgi:hypothetical protein